MTYNTIDLKGHKMETKPPRGRPPKNGTTMTGAQRAQEFRQRQRQRDRQRLQEILSVIRDQNRNEKEPQQ